MRPGEFVRPMLGMTADHPFSEPGWWYETKWDGYRAIISIGRHFHIYSRRGRELQEWLPILSQARDYLPGDIILDAELVGWVDGRPSFMDLQNRTAEAYILVVFDCLYGSNRWLLQEPLSERQHELRRQVKSSGLVVLTDGIEEDGEDLFRAARDMGMEGVMAKRLDSPYLPGKRSRTWQKFLAFRAGWYPVVAATSSKEGAWYWTLGETQLGGRMRAIAKVRAPQHWRLAGGDASAIYLREPILAEVEYRERTREGYLRHARLRQWRSGADVRELQNTAPGTHSLPRGGD